MLVNKGKVTKRNVNFHELATLGGDLPLWFFFNINMDPITNELTLLLTLYIPLLIILI